MKSKNVISKELKVEYLLKGNAQLEKECEKFLDECPWAFFQQTLEWRNTINDFKTDESIYVLVKNNQKIVGILPIYVYNSKFGNIINSIPYPGPLGGALINNQSQREEIFNLLIKGVEDIAQRKNCVLVTIISSPFIPDENLYRKYFQPTWELENYTLFIDLNKPVLTNSHFRNNLKRMLKKALLDKLVVEESIDQAEIKKWYKIHQERHRSINLEPLPEEIFQGAVKYFIPKNRAKFFLVKHGKKIEAGCLTIYHQEVVDTYMISGSKESYKNGAIYLLINHLLLWAKKNSFAVFNWESSKPRGGGPYNFKMQWGSQEKSYYFFTKQYGELDKILKLGVEGVKKGYKWHFVLPYSVFNNVNL
ncbi:GNAT family N-acetyltransferase [Candidatus Microgenomates bacterium]|nr:GNAT family N-acetyltransferase [Candidatus Microgenomates bacterium]